MKSQPMTAANASLINCHSCGLLTKVKNKLAIDCPRCSARIHFRKPNSVTRTWAFLIAAYVLYVPANLMPIMIVTQLGDVTPDTILSGVIHLFITGSWPIALVVFVASIFVPILKLLVFTYLVISVQIKSQWRPKDRTRLYRMSEAIGRWSMVDIFVVSLMVALVKVQGIAEIHAGPGAIAFGAVVVLTILAAMTFDPRMVWDGAENTDE